jgi:hypothetical protein
MSKILSSLAFAIALLAFAASEASAYSFLCEAVGFRSRAWGYSYYVVEAKLMALSRCSRRGDFCGISYCRPYWFSPIRAPHAKPVRRR